MPPFPLFWTGGLDAPRQQAAHNAAWSRCTAQWRVPLLPAALPADAGWAGMCPGAREWRGPLAQVGAGDWPRKWTEHWILAGSVWGVKEVSVKGWHHDPTGGVVGRRLLLSCNLSCAAPSASPLRLEPHLPVAVKPDLPYVILTKLVIASSPRKMLTLNQVSAPPVRADARSTRRWRSAGPTSACSARPSA